MQRAGVLEDGNLFGCCFTKRGCFRRFDKLRDGAALGAKTDATVMRLCIVNPAKQAEIFGRERWENIVSRSANFVRQQIQLFKVKENF
jgi:hypothetical protein